MLTNTGDLALVSRGTAGFNAALLDQALKELDASRPLASEQLSEYRSFYGLDHMVDHRHVMFHIPLGDERLTVQYFLPEAPQGYAMLVHGYYDHVGLFAHVIDYLLAQNLAVVAFDQLGHGLSSGARATIDSFDQYVEATHAVFEHARGELNSVEPSSGLSTEKWHWFAQSMGGAIVMEYLQQHAELKTGEIVLLAPLVRPYAWGINKWVFALAKLTISERPRTLTENAENPEFHALQAVDPLQPQTLPVAWVQAMVNWFKRFEAYPTSDRTPFIVQGNDDHTVAWKYNLKVFARRYPGAQTLIIDSGRHHLANESAEKRQQMWDYLDKHCRW